MVVKMKEMQFHVKPLDQQGMVILDTALDLLIRDRGAVIAREGAKSVQAMVVDIVMTNNLRDNILSTPATEVVTGEEAVRQDAESGPTEKP